MSLLPLIDRLAAFTPAGFPVVSLYLNTQSDQNGHHHVEPFVRKKLAEKAKSFAPRSQERESFDRDRSRIQTYLRDELRPSANGLALFASAGASEFFEAVQLEVPIEENRIYVDEQPHLYPLARLEDQYPRYAALILDTNSARLFVFGTGARLDTEEVQSPKTNRTSVGGWSEARYQRHVDDIHLHHAKEVVDALDRVVGEEGIEHVVLAGDEVIIPILRDQLPPHLARRVIDVLRLDIRTPEHEVLKASLEALRGHDTRDDAERVSRLLDQYHAGGLGVVGVRATRTALERGQVDELLISADPRLVVEAPESGGRPGRSGSDVAGVAEELVTRARQTAASVTFIEDGRLLAELGGVGAFLRYRAGDAVLA